jgi:hypothetical protein
MSRKPNARSTACKQPPKTDRRRPLPSPPSEEFVHAIADALKPWNCFETEVLAKVREAIDKVTEDRAGQWGLFDVGTRQENKRYAQSLLDDLNRLLKRLAAAPSGFFMSLVEQELEAGIAAFKENKILEAALHSFFACLDEHEEKPRKELIELSEKLAKLATQCNKSILNPAGPPPNSGVENIRTAFTALFLILDTSKKPPAAGDRNTPFCLVASLLFEAATGEHEPNLERACKYALRTARASGFIELFSKR